MANTSSHNLTTSHESCRMIADLLFAQGITRAVISPGSRNTPLIVALARHEMISTHVIVDERSAAFVALGEAQQLGEPVALVCTSGTALLNYAPAIAEAYYQHIPLVVISADRPAAWIDQNDSQTLVQPDALNNFVKCCCNIPAHYESDEDKWHVNRMINNALIEAKRDAQGPVHINVQLGEPLGGIGEYEVGNVRPIGFVKGSSMLDDDMVQQLSHVVASTRKVMILASISMPNQKLSDSLRKLSEHPNIVVLTENVSNVKGERFVRAFDKALESCESQDVLLPELLITFGGAPLSKKIKQFLRNSKITDHWRIGYDRTTIDTMQNLSMRVEQNPANFFSQMVSAIEQVTESNYSDLWNAAETKALDAIDDMIQKSGWCDKKAMACIMRTIPDDWRLQLSNGMSVRNAELFSADRLARVDCNRGVSGIDGSTSTALGASLVGDEPVLLITGDMSFGYDVNGLSSQYNSQKFKIIVIDNNGGEIFRKIDSTSKLPELETYFAVSRKIPVAKYAAAFGFKFYEAFNEWSLRAVLPRFFADDEAAILQVVTK